MTTVTVHPARELYAIEAETGAGLIRERIKLDPSAPWARALRVYAQILEARALALRGLEPVEVETSDGTILTHADGRSEAL
jgi:hypothetical protein